MWLAVFLKFTFVDSLEGGYQGDYLLDTMEARVSKNQSLWEQHWAGYHELLHALSDAYDIGLTEDQVEKLELY